MGIIRSTTREKLVVRAEVVDCSAATGPNNIVRLPEVEILIIMEFHF
jgi:hypothetical protein